jgi:hypothetical protein
MRLLLMGADRILDSLDNPPLTLMRSRYPKSELKPPTGLEMKIWQPPEASAAVRAS